MKSIVFLCGLYQLGFALFHMGFWRLFSWNKELKKISFANKGILQILNIQLIYFFLATGILCLVYPDELITTELGKVVLLACSGFWLIRTVQQFIFLRANHLFIHALTLIFMLGTVLFALPVLLSD